MSAGLALESTLLLHGVPRDAALPLARDLAADAREHGAEPRVVAVVAGRAVVGLSEEQLRTLLAADRVPKANTANLGVIMHRGGHAATTVATTMELASAAGLRVFSTGGIGGVHRGLAEHLDISADLAAFTRFPMAVVASGVKGFLDVAGTREALEALGVPVVGYRTSDFPAFYTRETGIGLDARFDDAEQLARFISAELTRTGRGVLVCNAIPAEHEIDGPAFEALVARARESVGPNALAGGRDATPRILEAMHAISGGRTLRANIELVRSNVRLGAALAAAMAKDATR